MRKQTLGSFEPSRSATGVTTRSLIQPRTIAASAIAVTLLMFGSAFLELRQSRTELLGVMRQQAIALAEAVERSSANIVVATEYLEETLSERLLNNAYYIARLDSAGTLTDADLRTFARENGIYRINIFNARTQKVLTSLEPEEGHESLPENPQNPRNMLRPIMNGSQRTLVMGLKQARYGDGQRFAVAIRRTRPGGGAIVLNLDASELLEFRRQAGIGRLISDLGDNRGIDYVVLQDELGIVAATKNVRAMSSLADDPVMTDVIETDTIITRMHAVDGQEHYEVLARLTIEGSAVGVLRIGLSLDELKAIDERMQRRVMIMAIVLTVLVAMAVTAIAASKRLGVVSDQYAAIRSVTGNILEHMNDAVISADGREIITLFNEKAAELFNLPAAEVLGRTVGDLRSVGKGCVALMFDSTQEEHELECRPGSVRTVSRSLSTVRRPNGSIESRTVVIKDLTDQRRMEREIRQRDRLTAMGELASGVAHEVRNPLNAISMIAQRYEREFMPRSGAKEYRTLTSVLRHEAARVNGIVQTFLKFARPPRLKIAAVSARSFTEHVATLFEEQARGKGVRFAWSNSVDGPLHIDRDQMTQAVLNLLQNALDAVSKGGRIVLTVHRREEFDEISVSDDGAGIPKDKLERVFDLYFTTKPDGTGMGLAIAQQIVSQHHGDIGVESERRNGTTFTIRLPRSGRSTGGGTPA